MGPGAGTGPASRKLMVGRDCGGCRDLLFQYARSWKSDRKIHFPGGHLFVFIRNGSDRPSGGRKGRGKDESFIHSFIHSTGVPEHLQSRGPCSLCWRR